MADISINLTEGTWYYSPSENIVYKVQEGKLLFLSNREWIESNLKINEFSLNELVVINQPEGEQ